MPDGPPPPPPASQGPLPPAFHRGGVRVLPGVPFADLPGARPVELDLHLPARPTGPVPAVVFLHGGGWRLGSRRTLGPMLPGPEPFERFAAAGIAVASVDYRLSGEATWPAQLDDAAAALRWLRDRADSLDIDAGRIALWGESAGAHLAALLGLHDTVGGRPGVAAVAAWYPPTDLPAIAPALGADPGAPDSREALLLGGPVTDRPEAARAASPVRQVHAGAPPFLLLHGEADRSVPCDQSRRLHRALVGAGVDVALHTYPGADHLWLGSPDVAADALRRTTAFLQDRLRAPA
jgi:acetyl esterase/lipase